MKKTFKKVVAVFMLVVMMVSVVAVSAFAANRNNVKHYNVYSCIGDSVASGFGLPDYNRRGKKVIYATRIEGSYGDLVAKDVGAKYYSLAYPGFTSAALRYELVDGYQMREWEFNQLENFSSGAYDKGFLDRNKAHIRSAIRQSDLITLDIGVNDTWYGTIALIYEIAKYGTVVGVDQRKTLDEELATYGSWGTVARNAMFYLAGFAENPQLWAYFWSAWIENLATYFIQYQDNYNAIMDAIYKINPNTTVVALASANSFRAINLTPGTKSGEYSFQYMDRPIQVDIPMVGTVTLPDKIKFSENPVATVTAVTYSVFYEPIREAWAYKKPGQYYYADVSDYDMIMKSAAVPMFEFMSLDDSGFNPHPTLEGSRYMADKIIECLPTR